MDFVENTIRKRFPEWRILKLERVITLPAFGEIPLSPLKLVSRTILVTITTILVSLTHAYEHPANGSCLIAAFANKLSTPIGRIY